MTDEELKAAAQAAAMLGGDWAVSPHESTDKWIDICGGDIRVDNDDVPNNPFDQGPAFAAYIAAANPATVLRILDERDAYRAEAERLTRERDELVTLAERRRDAIRERDRLIEERNEQLAETTAEFERVAGERDAYAAEVTRLKADREQMEEIEPGLYLMRGIKSAFSGIERRVGTPASPLPTRRLTMPNDWTPPRRARIDLFTPAERAIWDAVRAVEAAGADVRLTEAVNLLHAAREKVADYVDAKETNR